MNSPRATKAALALGIGLWLSGAAWAADPVVGQSKFQQNCASCHSVASTASVDRGRNNPAMIQGAITNIGQMGFLGSSLTSADLADIAAYLGNAPNALSFAQTSVGQSSAVLNVTVRASRLAALNNLTASISGDFTRQGGTCSSTLAAASSCTIGLAFAPSAAGTRSGSLSLTHSGITSAIPIALSGVATAAAAQVGLSADASTLDFGSQTLGTSSSARSLTLNNTGSAALNFSTLALNGSAAADFSRAGSCSLSTALAVGASCTVTLSFTPSAAGSRSATLDVAATAPGATGTATLSVGLSGTGQAAAAPAAALSAASLDFGSVTVGASATAQNLTLSNSGNAALSIQSIGTTGAFTSSHTCGSSLAAGASCAISVVFTPTGAGAASGRLNVSSNASGSPHSATLSGTGVLAATGALQWVSASSADFGTVTVGADAPLQRFTLSNGGNAAAQLGGFTLGGSAAGDFRIDSSSSCAASQSLAAGASCVLAIGFSPTASGSRSASLAVTASNASTPTPLTLSGTGQSPATPTLSLSATSLGFSATDASKTLTLSNTGTAVLQVSALSFSNTRFSAATAASQGCGSAPFSLNAGASCQLGLSWTAGTADDSATLSISANTTPAVSVVTLTATGSPGTGGSATTPANSGGGGCTLAAGSTALDPTLLAMAGLAGLLAWRRRRARA